MALGPSSWPPPLITAAAAAAALPFSPCFVFAAACIPLQVLKLLRKNRVTHLYVEGAKAPRGEPERDRATFKYLGGKVSRIYAYGNSEVYQVS